MNIIKIGIIVFASIQMFAQDSSNQEFLQRINELRIKKNAEPLEYDEELYVLGKQWGSFILKELNKQSDSSILEIAKNDRHFLHIKVTERFTSVLKKDYILSIGENIFFIMNTKPVNDIVEQSFIGWKHSASHYLQMIKPENTHVAFFSCYNPKLKRYVCISVYAKKKVYLHSKK